MTNRVISFLILCLFVWLIWSNSGKKPNLPETEDFISVVQEINPSDSLTSNIIGIQPYMVLEDYFTKNQFKEKIGKYIRRAEAEGLIKDNTILLFPEYIGTWLVLEGEKMSLAKEETMGKALTKMVLSNFFKFAWEWLNTSTEKDKAAAAIFRMKSQSMAKSYFYTFSELAKESNSYIAAGSIILPDPTVKNGNLNVNRRGPLYNASFIFGPDGKIIGEPILKAFPIESELPFVSAGEVAEIPVFDLPFAKTALLVCADSWFPDAYQSVNSKGAEILLVPSYCTGDGTMGKLWQGYSGQPEPKETNLQDINSITEKEAWEKYALPGQLSKTNIQIGMNVFLRGALWDLGADGQPLVYFQGNLIPVSHAEKAGIWSLNF
ncbi:Carbon-nitrogen hydrolase [Algoriphagus alkaliphilus]|uniref:Carbon-nitrogen hydrolase n=1 Tax=Algoriphagus alkaliphilus TaxID=279824 RepID=A0A1G5ZFR2_9BACT|nr:nitrilase-related carbon-nitrogen hydrolase [Algoriphagus alkaliphilus]SDA93711.1 Carbon-nitrogen hydrolase [Algoriphagus alkaliphilus]